MTLSNIRNAMAESLLWLRTSLNMTQREIADAVGVSYNTWCSYELGKASPRIDDYMAFFIRFGLDPVPVIRRSLFPDQYQSYVPIEQKREEIVTFFRDEAPDSSIEQMHYIISGETGSSIYARVHQQSMYDHLPMKQKLGISKLIVHEYMLSESLGDLINTEYPMPDVHAVVDAIQLGHNAVMAGRNSYTTLNIEEE